MLHTLSYSPFLVYVCIQYLFFYTSSRLAKKFNDILINYFFHPYQRKTHKNITNHFIILKNNIFIGRLNVKQVGRYFIPHIFHARSVYDKCSGTNRKTWVHMLMCRAVIQCTCLHLRGLQPIVNACHTSQDVYLTLTLTMNRLNSRFTFLFKKGHLKCYIFGLRFRF